MNIPHSTFYKVIEAYSASGLIGIAEYPTLGANPYRSAVGDDAPFSLGTSTRISLSLPLNLSLANPSLPTVFPLVPDPPPPPPPALHPPLQPPSRSPSR